MQQIIKMIAVAMIVVGENIRKHVEPEALGDLAISVKLQGVLNPLRVYEIEGGKQFDLESGQRRLLAAIQAGLTEVPCVVVPRPTDGVETGLKQHAENNCRQEETLIDKGLFYDATMKAKGWTVKQLAWAIGGGESDISRAVKTIHLLPQPLHDHVKSGALPGRTAYDIARARLDDDAKVEIGERAVREKLTGQEVRDLLDERTGKKTKAKKTVIKVKGGMKITVEGTGNVTEALTEALAQAKRG